jgi:hypothetical protein
VSGVSRVSVQTLSEPGRPAALLLPRVRHRSEPVDVDRGQFVGLGLLRYCARPPFALERLSVIRDADGRIARIRYAMPRHWVILWAANWVGPGRKRKSTQPGAGGVIELSSFEFLDRLADLIPQPRRHRHRYHGVFAPNHPLRPAVTALAVGNVGKRRDAATGGHAHAGHDDCCGTHATPRSHDTSRIAWAKLMARVGEEFPLECPACGGDIRLIAFITEPGPIHATAAGRSRLTSNRSFESWRRPGWLRPRKAEPPPISPARGPPTEWGELVQVHDDRDVFEGQIDELPATTGPARTRQRPDQAPPRLTDRSTVAKVPLTGLSSDRLRLRSRDAHDSFLRRLPRRHDRQRRDGGGHRGEAAVGQARVGEEGGGCQAKTRAEQDIRARLLPGLA